MLFCVVRSRSNGVLLRADGVLLGYSWEELPKGSVVVDVGAGFSSVTKVIAKAFPDFRCIAQDRTAIIQQVMKAKVLLPRQDDVELTYIRHGSGN